ncbi:hypothetical protein [Natranaerovirga pectinivora]|uniref:hypothetical protein n=1 Tax=Natranaerovirga pectinivora TaxID=682400 RepID=UPI001404B6BF|nr:hypothetical protein [Natranaerovirga pectinivora]
MRQKLILERTNEIRCELNKVWDITKQYWYPLFECTREDLISFDSNYIMKSKK